MPAQNGDLPAAQQVGKMRRSTPNRVVPVVPLMPRTARPQSKQESKSRAETATPSSGEGLASVSNGEIPHKAADKLPQPSEAAQSSALQNGHAAEENTPAVASMQTPESHVSSSGAGATTEKLTNGATSDMSEVTNRQPEVAARKPMDRFDMRQIRTELPPAFVPAADQHTPHSASSSQTRHHHPVLPHAHPTHPSAGSIVFGGHESVGSSPAPPLSSNSAFAPPTNPQQAPFFGHAHHASEPQGQRGFQPGYQQPPMPWQMRPGFPPGMPQPFHHPHSHMPMRYPPREAFMPGVAPVQNGHGFRSRSGSQASSAAHDAQKVGSDLQSPIGTDQSADAFKATFPEQKAVFPGQPRHLPPQPQQPMPHPNFAHPEMAINLENAEQLRDHVLSQLRNPELTDCHLQISEQEGHGRQYLEAHKLILARSSTLLSIIRNSEAPAAATLKTQVHVQLKGGYIRVGPFMEAIKYLYGGPLPSFDMLVATGAPAEERMELALQHIATGAWLNIAAFAHRGVEISASLLNWETIPQALGFALEGGLAQMWPIEDGSEERVSTCSSDDSFNKPEAGGSPTYDPFSSGLLHRAIDFAVHQLPPNFYLDSTAPQLAACPRLPAFRPSHESKSSRSDPRLSKIRFGEVPADDHQRPSFAMTTVSSILLSLPFPLLKFLLEHPVLSSRLGAETVASIMRQVVVEREVRRQKALKARTVNNIADGADSTAVHNLYWEELVEPFPQNRAGFRLARRRRGIDTPPSSGNESERAK